MGAGTSQNNFFLLVNLWLAHALQVSAYFFVVLYTTTAWNDQVHTSVNFTFSIRTWTPFLQIQLLDSSAMLDKFSEPVGMIPK